MDCRGHALTRRNWMWRSILTSVGAMLVGGTGLRGSTVAAQTATTSSAALDVLRTFISNAVMASAKAEAARRL